jgi:hypothetical protein
MLLGDLQDGISGIVDVTDSQGVAAECLGETFPKETPESNEKKKGIGHERPACA